MSLTKVSYSMIQGACVNALDYGFSETETASNNTTALQLALDTGTPVYIPTGTYEINGKIEIPEYSGLFGDGPNKSILSCDTDVYTGVFLSVGGRTYVENLALNASGAVAGTGIRFESNAGEYTFTGHGSATNVRSQGFNIGFDVNNYFDLLLERCEAYQNNKGFRLLPSYSASSDSGYYTTITLFKCYAAFNTEEGFYAASTINSRNLHLLDSIFDFNGGTYAQLFISKVFNLEITNCYFEGSGGGTLKWGSIQDVSSLTITGNYAQNTGGLDVGEYTSGVTIIGSIIQNLSGASSGAGGQSFYVENSTIGTTSIAYTVAQRYCNTTVNGSYEKNITLNNPINLTDELSNTTTLGSIYGYTKTVTNTIPANSSVGIISDQAASNIWVGDLITGIASISNLYNPGLILTVTPSSAGNKNLFCVIATNVTASPITITDAEVKVMFFRGIGVAI